MKKHILTLFIFLISVSAFAADRYWIASTTADWNSTANWSTSSGGAGGASVPTGSSSRAIFDSNGLGRCNINVSITAGDIIVRNGYSDTIVQENSYTITTSNSSIDISGGVFIGGTGTIDVQMTFTLDSNAVFTSTSGSFKIRGNVYISDGSDFYHNNGLFNLYAPTGGGSVIASMDTITLYSFTINNSSGNKKVTFGSNDKITVENDLKIQGNTTDYEIGLFSGKIHVKKDIFVSYKRSWAYGQGTNEIILDGDSTQTIDATGNNTGAIFKLTINKGTDTLKIIGSFEIHNDWDNNGCIMQHDPSSIITFKNSADISGNTHFSRLQFIGSYSSTEWNISDTLTSDSTLVFKGDGIVYLLGGVINCKSDFSVSSNTALNDSGTSSTKIGTTQIVFNGSGNQSLIGKSTGSKTWLPVVIINKSSGTLFLTDNISIGGQLHYIQGTIDYGTSTITFVRNCDITGNDFNLFNVTLLPPTSYGSAIDLNDSTLLTVNGTLSYSNSGNASPVYFSNGVVHAKGDITVSNDDIANVVTHKLIINGTGNQTLTGNNNDGTGFLHNIEINKSSGTLFLKDLFSMTGSWIYKNGVIDATTYNSTIYFTLQHNPTIKGNHTLNKLHIYNGSSNKKFIVATGTTITLEGEFKSFSSGTTVIDSGTIEIKGNITAATTLNGGTGTIKAIGSNNQTFTGTASLTTGELPNFTMNKSGGTFTVTNYLNVAKVLTLTNGIITTANSSSKVHLVDNATISGGSNTSYVDGIFSKLGNDAFRFGIGDAGNFRPLTMSAPGSTSDRYEAQYVGATQSQGTTLDTGIFDISECEYWNFTREVGSSSVSKKVEWSDNICDIPTDTTNLALAYYNGTKWIKMPTNDIAGDAKAGWIQTTSNALFGYYALVLLGPPYYYAKLDYELDNEYYLTKRKKLYFMYDEEYDVGSSSYLEYKVYNESRTIVAETNAAGTPAISGSPVIPVFYGENFLNMDLSSITLSSGYYILEVTGRKNDKFYLRFKI